MLEDRQFALPIRQHLARHHPHDQADDLVAGALGIARHVDAGAADRHEAQAAELRQVLRHGRADGVALAGRQRADDYVGLRNVGAQ